MPQDIFNLVVILSCLRGIYKCWTVW